MSMILLHNFLRSGLFVFFVGHFVREQQLFLAALFLFFVCLLAADQRALETSSGPVDICSAPFTILDKLAKMREFIILDDDNTPEVFPFSPQPQTQSGLTEQQRKRMAQQKEMAKARRLAKENLGSHGFGTCTFQNADRWKALSDSNPERSGVDGVQGAGQTLPRTESPFFSGVKREVHSADDENTGDQGWRSIRKRPVPGQSFGRDMQCGAEGTLDRRPAEGCAEWKRENGERNQGGAGGRAPSKVPEAQEAKLDWQKSRPQVRPSDQQMQVLAAIRNGKSVFLTGSAGTGKSFVLGYAIKVLKFIHGADKVYVTASTGLAACALGGTTLHSFAGVGLGTGSKESLVDKVKSRRDSRTRWVSAKALVLDEISMIDGEFFDKLDYVGRLVRNKSEPFGGIQLIVTGDFYQLPPVSPPNPDKYFAFDADCWDRCFDLQVELKTVFRQSDEEFIDILNEIRRGHCSCSVHQRLQNCFAPVEDASGIILTRLYPRKMDVARENDENLRALRQPTVVFTAKDEARSDFARKQLDNVRVEAVISLAVGAQVMLAKNLETSVGLVNGARGVIVGFISSDDPRAGELLKSPARSVSPTGLWPLVKFACDNVERLVAPESWSITEGNVEVAKRTQIPLLLAWALSVHKCQGMTLDRVETDLSRAFDYGMVYVALSRVKSMEGLRLTGFDPARIKVHPKVARFYDKLEQVANEEEGECVMLDDKDVRR